MTKIQLRPKTWHGFLINPDSLVESFAVLNSDDVMGMDAYLIKAQEPTNDN